MCNVAFDGWITRQTQWGCHGTTDMTLQPNATVTSTSDGKPGTMCGSFSFSISISVRTSLYCCLHCCLSGPPHEASTFGENVDAHKCIASMNKTGPLSNACVYMSGKQTTFPSAFCKLMGSPVQGPYNCSLRHIDHMLNTVFKCRQEHRMN
jgi:hypothetical protein